VAILVIGLALAAAFLAFGLVSARKHDPFPSPTRFGDLPVHVRVVIAVLALVGLALGVFLSEQLHD
jgi:uncharacterized protein YneF (UPF0154 family)